MKQPKNAYFTYYPDLMAVSPDYGKRLHSNVRLAFITAEEATRWAAHNYTCCLDRPTVWKDVADTDVINPIATYRRVQRIGKSGQFMCRLVSTGTGLNYGLYPEGEIIHVSQWPMDCVRKLIRLMPKKYFLDKEGDLCYAPTEDRRTFDAYGYNTHYVPEVGEMPKNIYLGPFMIEMSYFN